MSTKGHTWVRLDSGGSPRDWLIAALAVSMPAREEQVRADQARTIIDALDVYLEEPDRGVALQDLTPNYPAELEKMKAERDAAIEYAQKAMKTMQETLERLKA